MVVAALSTWHEHHLESRRAIAAITELPAHAMVEAYSVLTRLPSGFALPATVAAGELANRFDGPPMRLDDATLRSVTERLARAGVFGGATYDGLIALEAAAHGRTLLTRDRRAQQTYERLGVGFELVAG